jgi:hypothetical protein
VHAVHPVGDQRHFTAQQLGQALGHGGQRVFGLELAFGRAAQVAGHHHGGAGVQRHADGGNGGADAGVFGDVAGVVQRHVQVGTDEDALDPQRAQGAKRVKHLRVQAAATAAALLVKPVVPGRHAVQLRACTHLGHGPLAAKGQRLDQQFQRAVANPVIDLLLRDQAQVKTAQGVVDRIHDFGRGLHQRAIQVKHDQVEVLHA